MTIPSTVTSIGSSAFSYCYSIKAITVLATTPPTLAASDCFKSIGTNTKISVPSASVTAYQSASYWSSLSSRIISI